MAALVQPTGRPRRDRLRAGLLIYAALQFAALTVLAMLIYPGGAKFDRASEHYLFFQNFFSDLGATRTYSGRSNTASHVIFIIALVSVGLATIGFSPTWRSITARRGRLRNVGLASQIVAIASGIGFLGIAATPWDKVLDAHNAFVQLAFGILLAYVLCLISIQLANGWPATFLGLNAVYLFVLAAYVVILFAGPELATMSGLELQVAAQKVIVYASITNLGLQASGIRMHSAG